MMQEENNVPEQADSRDESAFAAEGAAAGAASAAPAADKPFKVVLASASPRRAQLLADAGVAFTVHASDIDETLDADLLANPQEACKKLAERKAGAVVQEILADPAFEGMLIVIGSDTMVVKDGQIFGKPKSASDATHMLRCLSGATHEVMTAVSVWLVKADPVDPAAEEEESGNVSLGFRTFCDISRVTFHELSDERIREYLALGESFDKAGAYAVQGEGGKLVAGIEGYKSTVIGLPVERLVKEFPDLI